LNASLRLYRMTLKRFRPAHVATHWLLSHTLIPLLERLRGLKTMPDDPFWFRLELLLNQHEPETTAHLRRLIQPGMVVLDVGAHVGYYARLFAGLVGSGGRVIAFEPHPRNYGYLQQNTGRLPAVTALQVAAAGSEGSAELYDYLMMSASGSLHYDETLRQVQQAQATSSDFAPRIARDFPVQTFTVRTARLDDCLAELGIVQVDVMKMDIEGAELSALHGCTRTIQQSPRLALVMEYNPLGLQAFAVEPVAAVQQVLALGFARVQVIESDGRLTDYTGDAAGLARLTARLMQHMGVVNLLFTR
jgi:FkbM family methyltransferase